ncbi:unnamed protein product [Paramecium pentaurelia]|uniref:Transmembrane protein n=1 Tax=Paramecium pentaurelia TaxID=43138 RepID=A0A8S1W3H8_9CILI|nr:unnamed protein product [Paramecium pentaurelia]
MKFVWLQILLAISLIVCQSQVCKLQQNYQNLLQMNEKETYLLYLQDYFYGDGLTYSLNDNTHYFQPNNPENLGGIKGEAISLIIKPKKVAQQKEFLLLLNVNEGNQETYEIHSLKNFSKKNKFSASVFIARFNSDHCYNMNQIDDFFIITCLDFGQQQITYLTFNSDYHLINTFDVNIDYAQKESKIITKSAGKYLCTLMNNGEYQEGEYVSHNSNLIIFQFEKTQNFEDSKILINLVQLNQIQISNDFITGFDIVKEGHLFITYFNQGIYIHLLNQEKQYQLDISLKKRILGISAQKISYGFYEYNIVCWDEQKLSNFLYDPSKNKIISKEKLIQTTQINLLLNFVTNVFINEKYIVVSNLNGISIYPTIINDVNQGRLLYYYPSKSKISYFINIIDYLISIEEQSLILYMINDPIIKLKNIEVKKTPQIFQIRAISNQFDKPQVECPTVILYFQVQNEQFWKNVTEQYFDSPYEVSQTNFLRGLYQDDNQHPSNIKINIKCDKIQQIKLNQMIIRNQLEIQPKFKNLQNFDIKVDKIYSEFRTKEKNYYLSDVAYLKQQLLYQYDDNYRFKEKLYLLTQQYFKIQLMECLVEDFKNCVILHTQNIEVSNRIEQFIFNIHNDQVYLGFAQVFGWKGYDNLDEFNIKVSNVVIFSYKLNEKNRIVKKYQISHFQHKVLQLEIIDDRIYMLYEIKKYTYIFTSKISDIYETMDILELSHKVDYCRVFSFNIEFYGYFLYYFTMNIEQQFTYLNIINIEDGKFELINKIKFKDDQQQIRRLAHYSRFTKNGAYISIAYESFLYFTRHDFFKMVFTQSSEKSYENFVKNQIKLPFNFGESEEIYSFTYTSSEKYYYILQTDFAGDYKIYIYNIKSTILNCIHYVISKEIFDFRRKIISSQKYDIFSLNQLENGIWRLRASQIQYIKHEPLITINCLQAKVIRNLKSIKIPFVIQTENLKPEQYPIYNFIIDLEFDDEDQTNNQESQIDSTLRKIFDMINQKLD